MANAACSMPLIGVIDPANRTGKIRIPVNYVFDTKGKQDAIRTKGKKDLSLCLLFQKGKCNAGGKCHQIHADCEFVAKLRAEAAANDSCCAVHGDANSKEYSEVHRTVLFVSATGIHIPISISYFAHTTGLEYLLKGGQELIVPSNKVCRLQQDMRCKYGRDCKNVHICRKRFAEITKGATTTTTTTTTSTSTATTSLKSATNTATNNTHDAARHRSSPPPPPPALSPDMLTPEEEEFVATKTTAASTTLVSTTILDSYLRGWHSSCRSASTIDSPLCFGSRSPLDIKLLCTDLLGM